MQIGQETSAFTSLHRNHKLVVLQLYQLSHLYKEVADMQRDLIPQNHVELTAVARTHY